MYIRRFSKFSRENFSFENRKKQLPWTLILNCGFITIFLHELYKVSQKKEEIRKQKEIRKNFDVDELDFTDFVYMNISKDNEDLGQIVLGLYGKNVPRTVENFIELSKKQEGGYKNTKIHRVVKDFMIQGGDNQNYKENFGLGGESIYGGEFKDENLTIPTFVGCIAMANRGKNTNASQFFITTQPTPYLDGKHVVFGRVLKGFNVIQEIEDYEVDDNYQPKSDLRVKEAGIFNIKESL